MSDRQIRDEVVTMLLAGHETVANALSWGWYLLGRHPQVEARLHDELDAVLGGRPPDARDFASLEFSRMTVAEILRLYPTAWHIGRKARDEDRLPGGHVIPARGEILVYIYALHRDPRFYDAHLDVGLFPGVATLDPRLVLVELTRTLSGAFQPLI